MSYAFWKYNFQQKQNPPRTFIHKNIQYCEPLSQVFLALILDDLPQTARGSKEITRRNDQNFLN